MKDIYRTIHEYGEDEIIIEKSRFIGYAKPVETEEEALMFIEEINKLHKNATHNVPAYVIGENSNIQRYNDDGEPSGTAGIPVLEVMKKEDLRNVVIVVTRYFGGIKLGAGGLVRAYTKGAKIALEAAKIVQKIKYKRFKFRFDYTLYGKIENEIQKTNYIIDKIDYDDAVNMEILCDKREEEKLRNLMIELTSSNVQEWDLEDFYFSVSEGKVLR